MVYLTDGKRDTCGLRNGLAVFRRGGWLRLRWWVGTVWVYPQYLEVIAGVGPVGFHYSRARPAWLRPSSFLFKPEVA